MKKINYSEFWSKLNDFEHTTIRKHKNWKLKQILPEVVKGKIIQDVLVFDIQRKILLDLEPSILLKDTDSNTVQEALDKISAIKLMIDLRYKLEPKDYNFKTEEFTIYFLRIVNPMRITDFF